MTAVNARSDLEDGLEVDEYPPHSTLAPIKSEVAQAPAALPFQPWLERLGVPSATLDSYMVPEIRIIKMLEDMRPHRLLSDGRIILPLRQTARAASPPVMEQSCNYCAWHETAPEPTDGDEMLLMKRCTSCKWGKYLPHFLQLGELSFSRKCFTCRGIPVSTEGDPLDSDLWSALPNTKFVLQRCRELYPHLLISAGIEKLEPPVYVWRDVELERASLQQDCGKVWEELSAAEKARYVTYLWTEGEFGQPSEYDHSIERPTSRWTAMLEFQFPPDTQRRIYARAEQLLALSKGLNMGLTIYREYFQELELPGVEEPLSLMVQSLLLHLKTRRTEMRLPECLRRHFQGDNREARALFPFVGGQNLLDLANEDVLNAICNLSCGYLDKACESHRFSEMEASERHLETSNSLREAHSELFSILQRRSFI